ncbi:MAG TPA: hypothetical protein ENK18_21180, partial [Deltaproteobacteria bacterium]|nr:hypothetical protein [Deltaproteobacteria bacterium]
HAGGSHAGGSHAGGSHAGGSHAGGSHAGAAPYVEGLTPVEAAWAAGIPPDLSPEPELFDAPTVIDPRKSGLRPRHEPDEIEGEGTDEIQTETSTPEIFGSSRSDPDLPQGSYEPGGELPSEAIPTEEHATEEPTAEEHLVEPELSGPGSLSPGEPPEEPVFYGPVSHDLPPTPVIEAAGEGTSTASGSDTSAAAPRVGTLAENVPRSMKVEVPVPVEIRLAVGSPEGITADMPGDGIPTQRSLSVTRAMSVRLVAPRGGFFIEPLSPETQWVDDPEQAGIARWSWKITPKWSGNLPLSVVVSSRTVGAGGLSAESRLPDQTFEISVGANHGRRMRRAGLWVGTAVAGSVVGMWGQEAFSLLMQLLSQGAGLP